MLDLCTGKRPEGTLGDCCVNNVTVLENLITKEGDQKSGNSRPCMSRDIL